MSTNKKIALLAEHLKVGNGEAGLNDGHIVIKSVRFFNKEGRLLACVKPTSVNKEERLLLQSQMLDEGNREIVCTDKFRWWVRSIFEDSLTKQMTDLKDLPLLKDRPLLFWMLHAHSIVPECEA